MSNLLYLNRKDKIYNPDVFTVVGSPTITDDGIISGIDSSNYVKTTPITVTEGSTVKICGRIITLSSFASSAQTVFVFSPGDNSNRIFLFFTAAGRLETAVNNSARPKSQILDYNTAYDFECIFNGLNKITLKYKKANETDFTTVANDISQQLSGTANTFIGIYKNLGSPLTSCSLDLSNFSITVDDKEVFKGYNYNGYGIKYQDVYTSEIEFKTQIIEKQQGEEQRYPQWTYPKRTFTLKFDKNAEGRKQLEEFFIDIMTNYGGKFLYYWDESKGGNGKTYTCWIDVDKFEMTIKDYGFCETELKFITIDENPISPVSSLDFYHKADANYSVAFNIIKDSIMNASYKMRRLWKAPRRSWTLTFQKDAKVRKQLEEFFISKRGKFRYFQWTWQEKYGGDGKTYNVRFDTDKLDMDILDYGFSEFQLTLKEVLPNPNPNSEYEKDELIPRKLLNIDLKDGGVHVLDNETLSLLNYNGIDYIGSPLEHGDITHDDNSSVAKLEITVSNIGQGISSIIGSRGNVIGNAPATLTMVLLNVNTNEIIKDTEQILWYGLCNNLTITNETAKMDIETPLGGYEYTCPVRKYNATCGVRMFKDVRCGYSGSETKCDRTFTRCKELGNQERFQGFISLPAETVIKA